MIPNPLALVLREEGMTIRDEGNSGFVFSPGKAGFGNISLGFGDSSGIELWLLFLLLGFHPWICSAVDPGWIPALLLWVLLEKWDEGGKMGFKMIQRE